MQTDIGNNNAIHYFDKNITAETFFADLLNLVFDYQLQNLNSQTYNHPFVDLCDKKNDIYIQVTSNKTSQKIKETIKGFETLSGITKKTKLIIFLLLDKPKYKIDKDIATRSSQYIGYLILKYFKKKKTEKNKNGY